MVFLFSSIMSDTNSKKLIDAIKQKGKNLEAEMSFFEHLEVLRWHLIRVAIAILVFMVLAFAFYDVLFDDIIMGPLRTDFWTYRMMCSLAEKFNLGADFCVQEIPINLINTELAGQF